MAKLRTVGTLQTEAEADAHKVECGLWAQKKGRVLTDLVTLISTLLNSTCSSASALMMTIFSIE